ncbi:nuclear transport factor 2 family protein [Enhygromyxa salina]|nr:nuclear transport factor 2 family protein [Enhygromyxa salina]
MSDGQIRPENPCSSEATDPSVIVRAALQRLEERDLDGYFALCADDMVYVSMTTVHGKEAARALDEAALAGLSDHWRRLERLLVSGDTVAVWLVFGGTPTGKEPFEVEFCNIFEVRDGLIQKITTYANWPVVLAQVGM